MKKVLFAVLVVVVALPFIMRLMPEPATAEDFALAIETAGYGISDLQEYDEPIRESAETIVFNATKDPPPELAEEYGPLEYRVELYRYDSGAKLSVNYEYLKPDPGTAIVESTNMAQTLGAAQPKTQSAVGRNGDWVCHVMGPFRDHCREIVQAFEGV